ncbi:MAG: hypothetical protein AB9842_07810 [Bacteroidales bacterium]
MKEQILHWLKSDRSYDTGVALYQHFGKSLSLKAILNRQGETPYNRGLLTEELRKLAEIDPDELKHILSQPVQKQEAPHAEPEALEVESEEEPDEIVKKKASRPASEKASGSGKNSPS